MASARIIMPLAKVIIAAAWADGDVAPEEINSMKDLFFGHLDLSGQDWSRLDMYVEAPVEQVERERLVHELNEQLRSRADQEAAIEALNSLVAADGQETDAERAIVDEIIAAIEAENVGIFKQIRSLFQAPVQRRSQALQHAPNREDHFEDFIRNRVYYGVRRRLDLGESTLEIGEEELRKLCLAGGLMARIAHADRQVSDKEIAAMVAVLISDWDLQRNTAEFVAEVAISEIGPTMEYYRMARQFFAVTTETERKKFIQVLFGIALADGEISNLEHEEIRSMNNVLKLTHQDFIAAKRKARKAQGRSGGRPKA